VSCDGFKGRVESVSRGQGEEYGRIKVVRQSRILAHQVDVCISCGKGSSSRMLEAALNAMMRVRDEIRGKKSVMNSATNYNSSPSFASNFL
jgi:galactokinase/mevalonate kinase-like predicted kinase